MSVHNLDSLIVVYDIPHAISCTDEKCIVSVNFMLCNFWLTRYAQTCCIDYSEPRDALRTMHDGVTKGAAHGKSHRVAMAVVPTLSWSIISVSC